MLDTKNDRLKYISFQIYGYFGVSKFQRGKGFLTMVWVPAFEETPFLVTL